MNTTWNELDIKQKELTKSKVVDIKEASRIMLLKNKVYRILYNKYNSMDYAGLNYINIHGFLCKDNFKDEIVSV